MTRREYLTALNQYLVTMSESEKMTILKEYDDHFRKGFEAGKSEAQISASLGAPYDVANEFLEGRHPKVPTYPTQPRTQTAQPRPQTQSSSDYIGSTHRQTSAPRTGTTQPRPQTTSTTAYPQQDIFVEPTYPQTQQRAYSEPAYPQTQPRAYSEPTYPQTQPRAYSEPTYPQTQQRAYSEPALIPNPPIRRRSSALILNPPIRRRSRAPIPNPPIPRVRRMSIMTVRRKKRSPNPRRKSMRANTALPALSSLPLSARYWFPQWALPSTILSADCMNSSGHSPAQVLR